MVHCQAYSSSDVTQNTEFYTQRITRQRDAQTYVFYIIANGSYPEKRKMVINWTSNQITFDSGYISLSNSFSKDEMRVVPMRIVGIK